jgi:hypothetical protein
MDNADIVDIVLAVLFFIALGVGVHYDTEHSVLVQKCNLYKGKVIGNECWVVENEVPRKVELK